MPRLVVPALLAMTAALGASVPTDAAADPQRRTRVYVRRHDPPAPVYRPYDPHARPELDHERPVLPHHDQPSYVAPRYVPPVIDHARRPIVVQRDRPPVTSYVWVPGYWYWDGARWQWIPGYYALSTW